MKKIIVCFAIFSFLYVGSYLFLSSQGQYSKNQPDFIGMVKWVPKNCENGTIAKLVYTPLINIDQRFVHKTYFNC